jgi:hypothetical protein
MSPFVRGLLAVVIAGFQRMCSEMGVLAETLEFREIGGWVYTRVVPPGGSDGQTPSPERIRRSIEQSTETSR